MQTSDLRKLAEAGVLASRPEPARSKRRRKDVPVNRTSVHITHCILGATIGTAVGTYGYLTALHIFGKRPLVVDHLWWLTILGAIVALFLIKNQMDNIRGTIFTKKEKGKVVPLRIRRRPEVIAAVCLRALAALMLASIIAVGLHLGLAAYGPQLGLRMGATASSIPKIGMDVLLVLFAGAVGLCALIVCELTLRLTQKANFPHLASCLFFTAVLSCSYAMRFIASYVG